MNELLRWALDLERMAPGDPGVVFRFDRPLPAYLWAGAAALALLAAWRSYWRLGGSALGRGALATVRAALLMTLAALLAGPSLVHRQERVQRDWAVFLLDRSESLTIPDAPASHGRRVSRDQQLRAALAQARKQLQDLSRDREVVWLGFDAGAYPLSSPLSLAAEAKGSARSRQDGKDTGSSAESEEEAVALPPPRGKRTRLGAAIDQALALAAARPVAGLVLASDGRSLDEPSAATLRQLRRIGAPLFVLPLGSAEPLGDASLQEVHGPGAAFVRDVAPVQAVVERTGPAAQVGAVVRLIDQRTGLTLDEKRLPPAPDGQDRLDRVTLTTTPETAGQARWRVVVVPDRPDLLAENNAQDVSVRLVDRPIRLLYVDGYPRWEARYFKNMVLREPSITSTNLLLDPTRTYTQESDEPLDRLPSSPEEWRAFDVVALGDVEAGVFTEEMLEQIRDHVAQDGAGLLLMGGPVSMPNRWLRTPLADLLPFTPLEGEIRPHVEAVVAQPTKEAQRLGVLQLGDSPEQPWPAQLSDPSLGWTQLRYAQRIEPAALKPAATPLALAAPVLETGADASSATPLVISMRYGAGLVVYVATDEIWRWRYGRGETLPERFWLPILRLLARQALLRTGALAQLRASPTRLEVDQPVQLRVELFDQALIDLDLPRLRVRVKPVEGDDEDAVEVVLTPSGDGRSYTGQWIPLQGGEHEARVLDPALAAAQLTTTLRVQTPDDELRRPETDHALLAQLARETGGAVLSPEDLASIDTRLPNRRIRLVLEDRESLWDTPAALLAVLTLLTIEWVGRRVIRLA
ncbi:MAG: hypothetical protein D6824_02605 [Planctomycetota bacterium]|nr:MAG: hypothetical protein D6824_02605 [Planctomycetota bacterium]